MLLDEKPDFRDLNLYTELLAEFKAKVKNPRTPYVLLGWVARELSDPGKVRYRPSLYRLNVGTINSGENDLARYLPRMVILDYWIPTPDKYPQPLSRGDVLIEHGWALEWRSAEGQKRLAGLKALIARAKGENDQLQHKNQEIKNLQQKLEEAEKKLGRRGASNA